MPNPEYIVYGSLILGSGRSPGGRTGNPLQYSCLENSMNRATREAPLISYMVHIIIRFCLVPYGAKVFGDLIYGSSKSGIWPYHICLALCSHIRLVLWKSSEAEDRSCKYWCGEMPQRHVICADAWAPAASPTGSPSLVSLPFFQTCTLLSVSAS